MGIMKVDCFRRLTRLFLCESGDNLKRTKHKQCVSIKVSGFIPGRKLNGKNARMARRHDLQIKRGR